MWNFDGDIDEADDQIQIAEALGINMRDITLVPTEKDKRYYYVVSEPNFDPLLDLSQQS